MVPEYDGQWQGIVAASDGACYFGSSTHSYRHGAGFFRFDPRSLELATLASDMTAVCGEDHRKTPPQGKIHSPIVESHGWLYFTTHMANYWDDAKNAYTGAHVIGYEIASRRFRDFGIIRPRFTIYSAIDVDPVRGRLYAFLSPFSPEDEANDGCHPYRVDVASGAKHDLGVVTTHRYSGSFWFYVDSRGDCWFTYWQMHGHCPEGGHGNLFHVLADTGQMERMDNVLPDCRLAPGGEAVPEGQFETRCWSWAQALPGRRACLFAMGDYSGGDERLWSFDPSKDIRSGEAFRPIGYIGPTFLSVALGGNRVYYIQRGDLVAARGWSAEEARELDPATAPPEDLHLKSISLNQGDEGSVMDHGLLVDQEGRVARHIDSLAADQDGKVYTVGSWSVLPGDVVTQQLNWEGPVREFHPAKWAQRFAFADVSKDLA
jgi:hypothetical protein